MTQATVQWLCDSESVQINGGSTSTKTVLPPCLKHNGKITTICCGTSIPGTPSIPDLPAIGEIKQLVRSKVKSALASALKIC